MLKRLLILVGLCAASFIASAQWEKDITMLVVPRETGPIKLAREISQRFPTLIVCYQQANRRLKLHAWNGTAWVPLSGEDYTSGSFCSNAPMSTVIIDTPQAPAHDVLIPDPAWSANCYRLRSTDAYTMLYLLGRHYQFPYYVWTLFAEKYDQPLITINPGLVNVPWYHYRGEELSKREELADPDIHMDLWVPIHTSPSPSEADVVAELPSTKPAPVKKTKVEEPSVAVVLEELSDPSPTPKPAATKKSAAPEQNVAAKEVPRKELKPDPFSELEIPAAELILPEGE